MADFAFPVSKKMGVALLVGGAILVFIAFGVGAFAASAQRFETFPQEFYVAGIDVSGKPTGAVKQLVADFAVQLERRGIAVSVPGYGTYKLPAEFQGARVFRVNVEETVEAAESAVQRHAVLYRARDLLGLSNATFVEPEVEFHDDFEAVLGQVVASWGVAFKKPENARFKVVGTDITVVSSIAGEGVDDEALAEAIEDTLSTGRTDVAAEITTQQPAILTADAERLLPQVRPLATHVAGGRTLEYKTKKFVITTQTLIDLLQPRVVDDEIVVSMDPEQLKAVAGAEFKQFEQNPQNAQFVRDGNRVTTFKPHVLGVAIDWGAVATDLYTSLSQETKTVAVKTTEAQPEISVEKTNELGIKEPLGVGKSSFAGSPSNRRHNIGVGVKSLSGVLIAPGETFSLIKTLGAIDGTTGYLQELVIKDNKTIPEYGGGLCQIGTTTFRAAMESGLPIVERRNHSYQVSYYYENGVSGTDATIYDPKPDFRFLNDTGHWIMIEPKIIDGNKLEFVFWGTSDGRKAERTIPKALSTTPAPPKKVIETTDLPPGVTKCTEKPHPGAHMVFTYSVQYPDGSTKKEDFHSYYKPWAEVCLVGVAAPVLDGTGGATITPTLPNSSTPIITPDASGAQGN